MILEQDAQQTHIKRPHRSWFEMANYLIDVVWAASVSQLAPPLVLSATGLHVPLPLAVRRVRLPWQAPTDAEFIWLSGQRDTCHTPLHPGNGIMRKEDGLFTGCASFCPHTYAISAAGAHKLLHAARKRNIYAAVRRALWITS